jgi:hypothetical protein
VTMDKDEFLAAIAEPKSGYWATFDEDGNPTGFYHEAVHGGRQRIVEKFHPSNNLREMPRVTWEYEPNPDCKIPEEAVQITVAEWERWQGIGE